jgi:hypothetical protein
MPLWAGGEPAGLPARPANIPEFPPVNDRPPPRDTKLITEEEQAKLERELTAARAAQAAEADTVKAETAATKNEQDAASAKPAPRVEAARNKPKKQSQN